MGVRLLTDQEHIALRTVGPPDEGPVSDEVFVSLEQRGLGRWGADGYWAVTPAGERALEADTLARGTLNAR